MENKTKLEAIFAVVVEYIILIHLSKASLKILPKKSIVFLSFFLVRKYKRAQTVIHRIDHQLT